MIKKGCYAKDYSGRHRVQFGRPNRERTAQLASLQFLEMQMNKLRSEIAVYQTARNSYIAALKLSLIRTNSCIPS